MKKSIFFHRAGGNNIRFKYRKVVSKWLNEVANYENGLKIEEVNVIFCTSEYHRNINVEYLGHDYFTDVITFDYSNLDEGYISGEIYIDVPTVWDNAKIYNTNPWRELHRVIVHGLLHLCGYGDHTDEEQAVMREREEKYLALWTRMMIDYKNTI